ncbi:hypothetical protein ES705_11155 [subsurface metagenome]
MKLKLGCFNDIREGLVVLENDYKSNINNLYTLNKFPLKFEDNSFNFIFCKVIFNYVVSVTLMNELHTILKRGGRSYEFF